MDSVGEQLGLIFECFVHIDQAEVELFREFVDPSNFLFDICLGDSEISGFWDWAGAADVDPWFAGK